MDELKPTGFEAADALDRFRAVRRGMPYKTLWPSDVDEAIEALEEKINRCPAQESKQESTCAVTGLPCCSCTPCCGSRRDDAVPENKPLTLEQLRQMDGEPVWIDGKDYGGWTIFKASANKQVARCLDNVNLSYYMDDYCKTWLAYARKPEKEEK